VKGRKVGEERTPLRENQEMVESKKRGEHEPDDVLGEGKPLKGGKEKVKTFDKAGRGCKKHRGDPEGKSNFAED